MPKIGLRSEYHWADGKPKRFYNADGTSKNGASKPSLASASKPSLASASKPSKTPRRPGRAAEMVRQIEEHGIAARTLNAITRPKAAGKAISSAPRIIHVHPTSLMRDQVSMEFDTLYRWLKAADAARGTYSAKQREQRDDVGRRVDLLRSYIWC